MACLVLYVTVYGLEYKVRQREKYLESVESARKTANAVSLAEFDRVKNELAKTQATLSTTEERLRDEQILREKLGRAMRPRDIPKDRELAFVEALSRFKGQQLEIVYLGSSNESKAFSERIQSVFTAAGWQA